MLFHQQKGVRFVQSRHATVTLSNCREVVLLGVVRKIEFKPESLQPKFYREGCPVARSSKKVH